jgi:hypothetical protein
MNIAKLAAIRLLKLLAVAQRNLPIIIPRRFVVRYSPSGESILFPHYAFPCDTILPMNKSSCLSRNVFAI